MLNNRIPRIEENLQQPLVYTWLYVLLCHHLSFNLSKCQLPSPSLSNGRKFEISFKSVTSAIGHLFGNFEYPMMVCSPITHSKSVFFRIFRMTTDYPLSHIIIFLRNNHVLILASIFFLHFSSCTLPDWDLLSCPLLPIFLGPV